MFEQAGTLDTQFTHNDQRQTAEPGLDVRALKIREAAAPGSAVKAHPGREQYIARREGVGSMRDSIASGGVKDPIPVRIWQDTSAPDVFDGHHRMYTAADLDPGMEVPVSWEDHRGPSGARLGEVQEFHGIVNRRPGLQEAAEEARTRYQTKLAADAAALTPPSSGTGGSRSGSTG